VAKVKGKRTYDSSLRKQQASQTRMRILDAAQKRFAERGYAASTIESIASAAGVAVDTVYATFGSKREVLKSLLDVRVGGDDAPIDLLDRPGPQAVRAERDQRRQLAVFASDVSEIIERVRPVDDIIRGAAAVDAEVAALRRGCRRVASTACARSFRGSWPTAHSEKASRKRTPRLSCGR
jgi:AcrR family transcriptional regulator